MLPCVLDPKSAAPKKPIRAYTTKAIPVTYTPDLQHDAPLPVLGLHACVRQVEDASYSIHCNSCHATFECKQCVMRLSGTGGTRQLLWTKVDMGNMLRRKHNVWI